MLIKDNPIDMRYLKSNSDKNENKEDIVKYKETYSAHLGSRNSSFDKQKFESMKLQLDNQRALIEFQKIKINDIQYSSTKNIKKFLNKTCQDIPQTVISEQQDFQGNEYQSNVEIENH